MHSINETLYKIKFFKDKVLIFIIFVLLLFASFSLGFLSAKEKIEMRLLRTDSIENMNGFKSLDFTVASRNGKSYYFLWCSGAGRIKKENLISFKSEKEAQKAGYKLSKTCR